MKKTKKDLQHYSNDKLKELSSAKVDTNDIIIYQLARDEGFTCRKDDDGYTLSKQFELMDMRIYFNKDLDLVRFTKYHSYPTSSEYIVALNVFKRHIWNIFSVINEYKNK